MGATGEATYSAFGRYEPLFRLGAGGMAEVYVARMRGEAGFERLVAVKQMLPHLAEDKRFVDMFLDEARVAALIHSPHVVPTLDLGRTPQNDPYLVMELVLGVALSTLMTRAAKAGEQLPVHVVCEMLAQAARGLHDAHEATTPTGAPLGIVHRDVSPRNVLVGFDGCVRITDFGVARALARRSVTMPGQVKGTFAYLSPEQAAGRPTDRRSDVFALGIVAWEALTGERLFRAAGPQETLDLVRSMTIPDVREKRPEVSEGVALAITRALERRKEARFATAAELANALRSDAPVSVDPRASVVAIVSTLAGKDIAKLRERLERSTSPVRALDAPAIEEGMPEIESQVRFATGTTPSSDPVSRHSLETEELSNPGAPRRDDTTRTIEQPLQQDVTPVAVSAPLPARRAIAALACLAVLAVALAVYVISRGPPEDVAQRTTSISPPREELPIPSALPVHTAMPSQIVVPDPPAVAPQAAPEEAARALVDPPATPTPRPRARPPATRSRSEVASPPTPQRPRRDLMGLDAFDDQARARD